MFSLQESTLPARAERWLETRAEPRRAVQTKGGASVYDDYGAIGWKPRILARGAKP